MMHDPQFALRCFKEAAPLWLASRVKIKPRTRQRIHPRLNSFVRKLNGFHTRVARTFSPVQSSFGAKRRFAVPRGSFVSFAVSFCFFPRN